MENNIETIEKNSNFGSFFNDIISQMEQHDTKAIAILRTKGQKILEDITNINSIDPTIPDATLCVKFVYPHSN